MNYAVLIRITHTNRTLLQLTTELELAAHYNHEQAFRWTTKFLRMPDVVVISLSVDDLVYLSCCQDTPIHAKKAANDDGCSWGLDRL